MLWRRGTNGTAPSRFVRSCNVYLEADGNRVIVAACFNHSGLTAEIAGGAQCFGNDDAKELGRLALAALDACIWEPDFNYAGSTVKDWPAYQASGEGSTKAFERRWILLEVRGANDHNVTWVIEAPTKRRFSLSLTAAVAPTTDAERLGQAIRYVQSELTQLTAGQPSKEKRS